MELDEATTVERVNQLKPFAFYIVDTLGSMYRNQVARQFHLIDENMDPQVKLGFHGHNNLQLAFSNARCSPTSRPSGTDLGQLGLRHGPGGGQPAHRLIARYINKNIQSRYNVAMVMDIYDEYIAFLRREYEWGYTDAYHYLRPFHGPATPTIRGLPAEQADTDHAGHRKCAAFHSQRAAGGV